MFARDLSRRRTVRRVDLSARQNQPTPTNRVTVLDVDERVTVVRRNRRLAVGDVKERSHDVARTVRAQDRAAVTGLGGEESPPPLIAVPLIAVIRPSALQ